MSELLSDAPQTFCVRGEICRRARIDVAPRLMRWAPRVSECGPSCLICTNYSLLTTFLVGIAAILAGIEDQGVSSAYALPIVAMTTFPIGGRQPFHP